MSEQLTDRALQIGRRIVGRFHEGVMAGDERAIEASRRHYDRLLCAINGGTTFGCRAGKDSPACLLEGALAAPDGETPLWGQSGRLFLVVNGMPCVADVESGLNSFAAVHFEFHACTTDMPFISETGYRSDYHRRTTAGLTVREAAEARFRACQENEVREILPERQLDDDLLDKPFVVDGLRNVAASLPAPGRRVWIRKQIGLVTTDPQALAEGKIAVALFSMQKKGRHRNAPLSTVVTRRVWPWDVREVRDEELADSTEPGRWLTLGMVHAVQAVAQADFHQ